MTGYGAKKVYRPDRGIEQSYAHSYVLQTCRCAARNRDAFCLETVKLLAVALCGTMVNSVRRVESDTHPVGKQ